MKQDIIELKAKKDFKEICNTWSFFAGEFNGEYRRYSKRYPREAIIEAIERKHSEYTLINDLSFEQWQELDANWIASQIRKVSK